jgi:hypothetical protein
VCIHTATQDTHNINWTYLLNWPSVYPKPQPKLKN